MIVFSLLGIVVNMTPLKYKNKGFILEVGLDAIIKPRKSVKHLFYNAENKWTIEYVDFYLSYYDVEEILQNMEKYETI